MSANKETVQSDEQLVNSEMQCEDKDKMVVVAAEDDCNKRGNKCYTIPVGKL